MTNTTNFKEIPFIFYKEAGEDKTRSEGHYCIESRHIENAEIITTPPEDPNDPYDEPLYAIGKGRTDFKIEELFSNTAIDWNLANTIHFHPSCTIPRYKLTKFCTEKKVKVIRDKDKADIILYGVHYTSNILKSDCDDFVKRVTLINRIKRHKEKRNLLTEILPVLEASTSKYVILKRYMHQLSTKSSKDMEVDYVYIKDYKTYQNLISGKNKYYHQDEVLKDIGTGALDRSAFDSICSMFESDDQANHKVAMEVMANCNYQDSLVYLLELMRRYYGEKIMLCADRTHVSFKALRQYLQYENQHYYGMDEMLKNVTERGFLTESNYKLILTLTMEYVTKSREERDPINDSNWKMTKLDLTKEYKDQVIWDKKEQPQLIETL